MTKIALSIGLFLTEKAFSLYKAKGGQRQFDEEIERHCPTFIETLKEFPVSENGFYEGVCVKKTSVMSFESITT